MISTECGGRGRRLIARPRAALFLLLVFSVVSVVSCGPDDDSGNQGGVLQITIDLPGSGQSFTLGSPATDVYIAGTVSESPYGKKEDYACNCVGFGCLIDPQCITVYVPRVHVTVHNSATGQTVSAALDYNSSAQIETSYSWHTTIPLAPGSNSVVSNASDGRDYAGSDSITIVNP